MLHLLRGVLVMCEPNEEICEACGHGAEYHQHADACRFEDCTCPCLGGALPGPFRPTGIVSSDERARQERPDEHTSRDGHWPASVGNMGGWVTDK